MLLLFSTLGIIIGLTYGIFGVPVGSTLLMTILVFLKFTFTEAAATSLFIALIPVTIGSVFIYWRAGAIKLRETIILAVTIAIGTTIGALVNTKIKFNKTHLQTAFGIFFVAAGLVFIARSHKLIK